MIGIMKHILLRIGGFWYFLALKHLNSLIITTDGGGDGGSGGAAVAQPQPQTPLWTTANEEYEAALRDKPAEQPSPGK